MLFLLQLNCWRFWISENETKVHIGSLLNSEYTEVLLHEILSEFNFNPAVIEEVYKSLDNTESGKQFFSKTHRLVKDREK